MVMDDLEFSQEFVSYFNVIYRELTELWWSYPRAFAAEESVEVDVCPQHYVV